MRAKTNSREKGKRGERAWRDVCRAEGYDARRTAQHSGSPFSPDVQVDGLPIPMHFEVKVGARPRIGDALHQAMRDCDAGAMPVVASRRDREDWIVSLRAEDFFYLVRGYSE